MPEPVADAAQRRDHERRQGDRRRGERRRGDRRQADRRRDDRRAVGDESWFAAVGVDGDPGGDDRLASRFGAGWNPPSPPDSRFLSREARRLRSDDAGAFQRLYRAFLAARAALGTALMGALILGKVVGVGTDVMPLLISIGYAVQAVTMWRWPWPRHAAPGAASRLDRAAWLGTVGTDLAAFSALYLLEPASSMNYVALLVLPVLTAAVLTPRRAALGTTAAVVLLLLVNASRQAFVRDVDVAVAFTPVGLAGIGLFMMTLLAGELASRLAREERAARGSLELARQQAQLNRLVIDEMSEGVLVIDRRARVRTANPAARRLLVADGSAPPAPFGLDASPPWRALAQAVEQAFQDRSRSERGHDVRLEFAPGVGRTLRVRARFTRGQPEPDRVGDQAPAREDLCVLFVEDLRSVNARTRQEKLAAMGRMSAGIAHEIRNPLAAIAQANALLLEDPLPPPQQHLAKLVGDNVQRLKRIVDDVLDVVPGALAPPRPIDARAEVQSVVDEWARTAQLPLGPGSRLEIEIEPAVPQVLFDPEHLRRVLVNLLDNAQRHAGQQSGAIALRLAPLDAQRVELGVSSDGPPIAADVEPHLFEPFFSTRSRGSGLGLYICRELCERHGASIEYRARPPGTRHRNQFVVTMRTAAAA